MTLLSEYKNQIYWRGWESYIDKLPIKSSDTVLDLGCGIGNVTKLLSNRALEVTGIDGNNNLLEEARKNYNSRNINYINHDLKTIDQLPLTLADGIWVSFAAAYFPDFQFILRNWLQLLKPGGWLAIVEINDLFGHQPLSSVLYKHFKAFYSEQRTKNHYDYEMGNKIKHYLLNESLFILHDEVVYDIELSFKGPANAQILQAWENRLNRLTELQQFFGEKNYSNVKAEFLNCLMDQNHFCTAEINYIIATFRQQNTI